MSDAVVLDSVSGPFGTTDISLRVARGARVVLVGSNGAGKSTLLRLVAGQRKATSGALTVFGEDAFEHTALGLRVSLVTNDWTAGIDGTNLPVLSLVASAAAGVSPTRIEELVTVLGAHALLGCEVNSLSEGERRCIHLLCKLLPERELLLLDEATSSLDVVRRGALLTWLRRESEARGVTVVFCTHVFDGLDGWATSVVQLSRGRLKRHLAGEELPGASGGAASSSGSAIYDAVLGWLSGEAEAEAAQAASTQAVAELLEAARTGGGNRRQRNDDAPAPAPAPAPVPAAPVAPPPAAATVAATAPAAPEPASRGTELPIGWGSRGVASSGGFGDHVWEATAAPTVSRGNLAGGSASAAVTPGAATAAAAPPPAVPSPAAQPPAAPPPAAPPPAAPSPSPSPVAAAMTPPILQALAALQQKLEQCAAATKLADGAAVSAAHGEVAQLWKQTDKALQMFATAAATPAPAPAPPAPAPVPAPAPAASQSGLPEGWGDRGNSLSADTLVRRGIIAPDVQLSSAVSAPAAPALATPAPVSQAPARLAPGDGPATYAWFDAAAAPRLASNDAAANGASGDGGGGGGGGAAQSGLPEGWGDRGNSLSADTLVRRGIIAPDVPMSQR